MDVDNLTYTLTLEYGQNAESKLYQVEKVELDIF
ncbi:hypothetical protein T11_3268 [Trichinella zimbabwensis]|uniref:Uncharacterized protein n=1 Tax=Trichinella zimbabwensis TaxID=268475 RepID=A0A0V1GJW3_9BILA|nr:hypothetical protein T11_3268 [Trichinella zimbabwensis]